MKKKTLAVFAILVSSVCIALLAAQFWLKPRIEEQIRATLDECNNPDGPFTIAYDKNALAISLASRTLHLKSVTVTSTQTEAPAKISFDSISLQVPADMLFFDAEHIPATGDILLANHVSLQNVSLLLPNLAVSVEQQEIDGLRCGTSLLRSLTDGNPMPDMFALLAQMGVERHASQNMLFSASESALRVAIGRQQLENWRSGKIGHITLDTVDLAGQAGVSGQIEHFGIEQLQLSEIAAAIRLLTTENGAAQTPEQTLATLLHELGNGEMPPLEKGLVERVTLAMPEGNIELDKGEILWPSVKPQNFSLSLNAFSLPKHALWAALQQEGQTALDSRELEPLFYGLDALRGNISLSVRADERNIKSLRESIMCDIPDWGTLRYAHTGDYANPMIGAAFSDIALEYVDNSLLARAGLVFFPNGDAERQALRLLDNVSSHGNAQLVQQLKNFVSRPGTLRVTSLPGKQLGEASLFLILASPADYLSIETKPAATPLTEQGANLKKFQ